MKKIVAVTVFLFAVAVSGTFAQTTADEWYKKASEYHNSGDYTNAITAYSETIKRDSSNIDAYWNRGNVYFWIKNYNAAISDYTKVITAFPNVPDAYYNRSSAYYQIKNYDAAIADCNTIIKVAPDFQNAYISRGDAYGAKGIYHKAVADYRTGLEKGYDTSTFNVEKTNKADMWFCGAMYMEIVVNRFLGKSDVVTKYENWLKTVCDKNNVTRAEVETYYRNGIRSLISDAVDEEFNKVSFTIRDTAMDRTYGAVLTRNPQTREYVLSYERPSVQNSRKELTAQTPQALLVAMRDSKDFSQSAIDTVEAQAALIPAVIFSDGMNDIKTILTNFYIMPNTTTYNAVRDVYTLYTGKRVETGRAIYELIRLDYVAALAGLNAGLARKVVDDKNNSITTLSADQQKRLLQLR